MQQFSAGQVVLYTDRRCIERWMRLRWIGDDQSEALAVPVRISFNRDTHETLWSETGKPRWIYLRDDDPRKQVRRTK